MASCQLPVSSAVSRLLRSPASTPSYAHPPTPPSHTKQVDKHLDMMQQSFDAQQDAAARRVQSGGKKSGGGGADLEAASVIQSVMWSMQATLKLGKVAELLKLMLADQGERRGSRVVHGWEGSGGGSMQATLKLGKVAELLEATVLLLTLC
jgi:hypothetical protein